MGIFDRLNNIKGPNRNLRPAKQYVKSDPKVRKTWPAKQQIKSRPKTEYDFFV